MPRSPMTDPQPPAHDPARALSRELTREERLAAKLRENLHRRKQQARNLGQAAQGALSKSESNS